MVLWRGARTMKTHRLIAWLAPSTLVAVTACTATAAGEQHQDLAPTEAEAALSTVEDRYLLVRHDGDQGGGFIVHELNRGTEAFVSSLQLAAVGEEVARLVAEAGDDEIIVRGHLDAMPTAARSPVLVAREAFRGMPGVSAGAGDAYFTLTAGNCTADDCLPAVATWLNLTEPMVVRSLSVEHAATTLVDTAWLRDRVLARGAVVAATVTDDGLLATQVFVRLPDAIGPCPTVAAPSCADGTVPVFARDGGRCLVPTGCSLPGECVMYRPVCAPGYTLHTWMAGTPACPAYACDPNFVTVN
jgi:hypothetical protein